MKSSEIQAAFAALMDTFEPITGQPTDEDMTRLKNAILQQVVPIPFDTESGEHNLMGLILSDFEYQERHENAFPAYLTRPKAYPEVAKEASLGDRAQIEATHKAKVKDWETIDCARREVRAFIIANVEDTWIREHHDPVTMYSYVSPRTLLNHLWASCTGLHSLDVLALRDSMRTMHKDSEGIPEYINALEDAQRRSRRAGDANAFSNTYLVMVATSAMLSTQQFETTNEKWEDLLPEEKTWALWKKMYKSAESKAKVRHIATGGKDQFGAAHRAQERPPPAPSGAPPSGKTQGEQLDEYFDALVMAATTDQSVLAELVANNSKLTLANSDLVKAVAVLTKANEVLTTKLGQAGGGRGGGRAGRKRNFAKCPHCKKNVTHSPDDCYELEKNKGKRFEGWKSVL